MKKVEENTVELLVENNADWVLKAFPFYNIFLEGELKNLVLSNTVRNPISLAKYLLNKLDINNVTPRFFFKKVLQNTEINTKQRFKSIVKILRHTKNIQSIENCISYPLHRYENEPLYKEFIDHCIKMDKTIVPLCTKEEIDQFHHDLAIDSKIEYLGEIKMPYNWELIDTERKIIAESKEMKHCVAHKWCEVYSRDEFIIKIDLPERLTVSISKHPYHDIFEINEVKGKFNRDPFSASLSFISKWLFKKETQSFFSLNTTPSDLDTWAVGELRDASYQYDYDKIEANHIRVSCIDRTENDYLMSDRLKQISCCSEKEYLDSCVSYKVENDMLEFELDKRFLLDSIDDCDIGEYLKAHGYSIFNHTQEAPF